MGILNQFFPNQRTADNVAAQMQAHGKSVLEMQAHGKSVLEMQTERATALSLPINGAPPDGQDYASIAAKGIAQRPATLEELALRVQTLEQEVAALQNLATAQYREQEAKYQRLDNALRRHFGG